MRLSAHVGRGDIKAAKLCIAACVLVMGGATLTLTGGLCWHRHKVAQMYTSDVTVQELVLHAYPALCFGILTDGAALTCAFALQALSRTKEVASAQFIATWLVCACLGRGVGLSAFGDIPSGIYFGFISTGAYQGIFGIILADSIGHVVNTCICATMLFRINWQQEVENARLRNTKAD